MRNIAFILVSLSVSQLLHAETISLSHPVRDSLKPDTLYFSFDIMDGKIAPDESGNSLEGNLREGSFKIPGVVNGKGMAFGKALHFEGGSKDDPAFIRNPYIFIEKAEELNLVGESFTMGVWIKFDDDAGQRLEILSQGVSSTIRPQDGGYTWALERKEDGTWAQSFQIRDGAGANPTVRMPNGVIIPPEEWHHLGVTFDHENHLVTFYFDGEALATLTISADIGVGDEIFVIGERRTSVYVSDFKGTLDDLFITKGAHQFSTP